MVTRRTFLFGILAGFVCALFGARRRLDVRMWRRVPTGDAEEWVLLVSTAARSYRKRIRLSGCLLAVTKAGRREELAYQLTKRAREVERDIEYVEGWVPDVQSRLRWARSS